MEIRALRGMKDVGEPEIHLWQYIEKITRALYEASGFHEIRTPILESTALFKRGVGDTTDIVEKEMYTFNDRNGDSISLRPEGTASVVRAILEHKWLNENPVLKLYYMGPMFRHERPQKGRYRQHTQFGLEIFGVEGPDADVEIIATQHLLFQKLGLKELELQLSSVGCQVCRPAFREKLVKILTPRKAELCEDCQRRLERNPLRIFDCKVPNDRAIAATLPTMLENLCEACQHHHDGVKAGCTDLQIPFRENPMVVRGLDYYTRTSFEFVSTQIGSQGTVCGGGRYDGLVEQLGGPVTPAVGCGMGEERLAMLLEHLLEQVQPKVDVFFVLPDTSAKALARQTCQELRAEGIRAEMDLQGKSMKSQMKRADKLGSRFSIIIGENEIRQGTAAIKDMKLGQQAAIPLSQLVEQIKEKIRGSK